MSANQRTDHFIFLCVCVVGGEGWGEGGQFFSYQKFIVDVVTIFH